MFVISFPDNWRTERSWISSVLFHEFLCIEHEIRFDHQEIVRICAEGKSLELSDTFFGSVGADWLAPEALPSDTLPEWVVSESGLNPNLVKASIPVIFGDGEFRMREGNAFLGLDIFGAAFFMLSRFEEAVNKQRDAHDRFPAHASLAYRAGFLDRPVIDEYVEILWCAMTRLWPQAKRRQREYKTVVSCDVDQPYHPGATSFWRMARATAGKTVRQRSLKGLFVPALNYLRGRRGDFRHDPFYFTVDWIMDVNEKAGNTVAFNFIPEVTDPVYDDTCTVTDPAVGAMLKKIDLRRHEIGLHPGYHAYKNVESTRSGLGRFRKVLSRENISQQISGGRNHYLRWSTQTPSVLNASGLRYDSTLGYADRAGFRCGTCHEYSMFDLHERQALDIKQRPLICMDCSVVDYMGYGLSEAALAEMEKLKRAAQIVSGDFSLLWHNSYLEEKTARQIYCEIIN